MAERAAENESALEPASQARAMVAAWLSADTRADDLVASRPEKSRKQPTTPESFDRLGLTSLPRTSPAHTTGRLSQMKPSIAEVAGLLERHAKAEGQRDGHVNGPSLPEALPAQGLELS